MPSQPADQEYGHTILQAIETGDYPESQDLISSEIPSSALLTLINLLESVKETVEDDIRSVSRAVAPDVEGWIKQAQHLQSDIQECQSISHSIALQAEDGIPLQDHVRDVASKVALLQEELSFNQSLTASLHAIRNFQNQLRIIYSRLGHNDCVNAGEEYAKAKSEISRLKEHSHARVSSLLQIQFNDIHQEVKDSTRKAWFDHVKVYVKEQRVELGSKNALSDIALCLQRFELLEPYVNKFCKDFIGAILSPRMPRRRDDAPKRIEIYENVLRLRRITSDQGILELLDDLVASVSYLNENLPQVVSKIVSKILMPKMLLVLTDEWLASAIPIKLEEMDTFRVVLDLVQGFAQKLDDQDWPGRDVLIQWTRNAPHIWLSSRKERALTRLRNAMSQGFGELKLVKREETRVVSSDEVAFATQKAVNWNTDWSDDDQSAQPAYAATISNHANEVNDGEDISAWGLEENDEMEEDGKISTADESTDPGDGGEAWGWDDDPQEETSGLQSDAAGKRKENPTAAQVNGQQEITLEEEFYITQFPGEIIKILEEVLDDTQVLSEQKYSSMPVAPAASGLISVPSLILTFYRASAPALYTSTPRTNMLIYNDSLWLSEQLPNVAVAYARLKLSVDADVKALETFGKGAYSKELEAQKTILSDLMDGAQGFLDCTEPPYSQECDIAIASTVDRLRYLDSEWRLVLSRSALLQSLGSLLATVINKMIIDIEDMSNISDPQSQRLAAFCGRITLLGNLFIPQAGPAGGDEDLPPHTAIYTPGWLKFQYLANILESSLVDIKYLWIEGELGLEMTDDEVVGLIEALFEDSDHRRRAIGEIRRHVVQQS